MSDLVITMKSEEEDIDRTIECNSGYVVTVDEEGIGTFVLIEGMLDGMMIAGELMEGGEEIIMQMMDIKE